MEAWILNQKLLIINKMFFFFFFFLLHLNLSICRHSSYRYVHSTLSMFPVFIHLRCLLCPFFFPCQKVFIFVFCNYIIIVLHFIPFQVASAFYYFVHNDVKQLNNKNLRKSPCRIPLFTGFFFW